jgi:hypothetical protein
MRGEPFGNGYLVLERREARLRFQEPRLTRASQLVVGLSGNEVLSRFGGLEGVCWPLDDGLPTVPTIRGFLGHEHRSLAMECLTRRTPQQEWELLWCSYGEAARGPFRPPDGFDFVGFDVVMLPCEVDVSSIILSDVIFGARPTLRAFGSSLNRSLLAPGFRTAEEILATRLRLIEEDPTGLEELDEDQFVAVVQVHRWRA